MPGGDVRLSGEPVGEVRSACWSPTLERLIAMVVIDAPLIVPGARFDVELDTGRHRAERRRRPSHLRHHTSCARAHDEEDMMAIATRNGAYIGGQWIEGDGERIEVTSPGSGESRRRGHRVQRGAGRRGRARPRPAAFPAWRAHAACWSGSTSAAAPTTLCMERNEEIAQMITREMGKTIRESREEMVEYTADHFRRASEDVLRHAGQVLPSTQERDGTKRILVVQEPVGVVAAVSPWNFPVDIAGIPIVYGLAAGCTIVWKPSEFAPLCAGMFVELLEDAGFPAGTVNLVHGRGETGSQLVRHPDVASVVFTGSVATGEQVARDAGLKNRVLELGGNGPQIVLADADIEKAADAAITGCFYLAGQCCTAAERILVHSSVQDAFVRALVERVAKLKVGDPLDDATDMGPLCDARHAGAHQAARGRRGREGRDRRRTAVAAKGSTTSRRCSPA